MVYGNRPVSSIPPVKTTGNVRSERDIRPTGGFADILQDKLQSRDVKISKHAQNRLETRNLQLDEKQKAKLVEAVDKADSKGVRDTLVVMDNMALVVNVRNRTVITAVNSGEMKENVFTNIDGAVFAD